jgi:hypothetical protein
MVDVPFQFGLFTLAITKCGIVNDACNYKWVPHHQSCQLRF